MIDRLRRLLGIKSPDQITREVMREEPVEHAQQVMHYGNRVLREIDAIERHGERRRNPR